MRPGKHRRISTASNKLSPTPTIRIQQKASDFVMNKNGLWIEKEGVSAPLAFPKPL